MPFNGTIPFEIPAGLTHVSTWYATGTQNYKCSNSTWALNNANAEMWDNASRDGTPKATHYFLDEPDAKGGRPTWKHNQSGSYTTVKVINRKPAENPSNVDYLQGEHTTEGKALGDFKDTQMVLRLETKNGLSPPNPCTDGKIEKMPYQAAYLFYEALNGTKAAKTTTAAGSGTTTSATLVGAPTTTVSIVSSAAKIYLTASVAPLVVYLLF